MRSFLCSYTAVYTKNLKCNFILFLWQKFFFTGFSPYMNVSFTGIDNISVAYAKLKTSPFTKGEIYSFFGNITDDSRGMDKTDFETCLKKAGSYYEWNCRKDVLPDSFFIQVMKEEGDSLKIPPQVSFFLNCCKIPMNTDKNLPIFSYIGKTIVKIKEMTDNPEIIKIARKADKMLMDEIIKYLG